MEILLASTNEGKIIEISEGLSGLPVSLLTPNQLPSPLLLPEETGETFEENALLKARFCFEHTGLPTLADDSGLTVEALHGELGLHTRRWGAGSEASDEEWVAYFLKRMRGESNKRACFFCHLAYIDGLGTVHTFEGTCEGTITESLEGSYLPGLPISSCFMPYGCDTVFSNLSIEQKNCTGHRGRATLKFRKFLEEALYYTSIS